MNNIQRSLVLITGANGQWTKTAWDRLRVALLKKKETRHTFDEAEAERPWDEELFPWDEEHFTEEEPPDFNPDGVSGCRYRP